MDRGEPGARAATPRRGARAVAWLAVLALGLGAGGCRRGARAVAWLAVLALGLGAGGCRRGAPPVGRDAGRAVAPDAAWGWVEARDGGLPRHRVFPNAGAAVAEILRSQPRFLGFGEYHQRTAGPAVPSALKRFTDQVLPVLAPVTSDLVVETWVTDGQCGAAEKKVVTQVKKTTERPQETESEIVTLARRARAAHIQPHALKVGCADYRRLLGSKDVDYVKLLELIGHQLRDTALEAQRQRQRQRQPAPGSAPAARTAAPAPAARTAAPAPAPAARTAAPAARTAAPAPAPRTAAPAPAVPASAPVTGGRRVVVLYGGALHNDRYPAAGLEAWSYAADLARRGRYTEVDLYVPEYVAGDERLAREPWYPLLAQARPDRVILVERGAGSYIVILATTPPAATRPQDAAPAGGR